MPAIEMSIPGSRSVNAIYGRMTKHPIDLSAADDEVPTWQRSVVWNSNQQGYLALSIILGYPIGQIILWTARDKGPRVPVDGRQRLSAIKAFKEGKATIPKETWIEERYRGCYYETKLGSPALDAEDRERFDQYELSILEISAETPRETVMEVFVRLQAGMPLTMPEIRSALGGDVCDFVTSLVPSPLIKKTSDDDEDDEESDQLAPVGRHKFFELYSYNNKERRKSYRQLCDVLLSEYLHPGGEKGHNDLLTMYRTERLTEKKKGDFISSLDKFTKAITVSKSPERISPFVHKVHFVYTFYRAWIALQSYKFPEGVTFAQVIDEFEQALRSANGDPELERYSKLGQAAALSSNRANARHEIFMSWTLKSFPGTVLRDDQRLFSEAQKMAIWWRAGKRCEAQGCEVEFPHWREADADHWVRHTDGGATTVENGRLLCRPHNRSGKQN